MKGRANFGWCIPVLALAVLLSAAAPAAGQDGLYDLLVSNRDTNSVKRFDGVTGEYIDDFVSSGAGGLGLTQEVRFAPDGDLIASGRSTNNILRFDPRTGAFKGAFSTGYTLNEPTKMTWGPDGNLYVSQWGSTRENVAVFGPDGAFIREATPGIADPMQHAWDADGNLLVVYWASKDVRRFDAQGAEMDVFVTDSRLQGPVNLRWDENQNLQVFDWESGAIYRYDGEDGLYLDTYIPSLRNPEGWTIGPDGTLYVAEWAGNAIKRFDPESGDLISIFAQGNGLGAPNSVLFIPRPIVYQLRASTINVQMGFGSTASFAVEVEGERGVSYGAPIELACESANSAVQCSMSTSTVTPDDGVSNATVTLTSSAPVTAAGVPLGLAMLFLGLAILGVLATRSRRLAVATMLLVPGGCGGDGTGPGPDEITPISTSVQIVATSDGLTETVSVNVSVRQNS